MTASSIINRNRYRHSYHGLFGNKQRKSPAVSSVNVLPSLKLAAKAPENGRLEDDPFLLGWPNFTGELLVSFREGRSFYSIHPQRQVLSTSIQQIEIQVPWRDAHIETIFATEQKPSSTKNDVLVCFFLLFEHCPFHQFLWVFWGRGKPAVDCFRKTNWDFETLHRLELAIIIT